MNFNLAFLGEYFIIWKDVYSTWHTVPSDVQSLWSRSKNLAVPRSLNLLIGGWTSEKILDLVLNTRKPFSF